MFVIRTLDSFGGRTLLYERLFRDTTGDSKDVTFIFDVFVIQKRAWECRGQGTGWIEGCVPKDKRK